MCCKATWTQRAMGRLPRHVPRCAPCMSTRFEESQFCQVNPERPASSEQNRSRKIPRTTGNLEATKEQTIHMFDVDVVAWTRLGSEPPERGETERFNIELFSTPTSRVEYHPTTPRTPFFTTCTFNWRKQPWYELVLRFAFLRPPASRSCTPSVLCTAERIRLDLRR